jgi:hypothetical protein
MLLGWVNCLILFAQLILAGWLVRKCVRAYRVNTELTRRLARCKEIEALLIARMMRSDLPRVMRPDRSHPESKRLH